MIIIFSTEVNLLDIQKLIGGNITQFTAKPYEKDMACAVDYGEGYNYFFEIIKEVAVLQRLMAFEHAINVMDRVYHSAMQSIIDENWFTYRTNIALRTGADFRQSVLLPSLALINESQERRFYREISINLQIMHRSEAWFNKMKYQNPTTQRRNRLATARVKRFTDVKYNLGKYLAESRQAQADIQTIYNQQVTTAREIALYRRMIIEQSYVPKLISRMGRLKISDAEYNNVKNVLPKEVRKTNTIARNFNSVAKSSIGLTGKNIDKDLRMAEKTGGDKFNRRNISHMCASEAQRRLSSVSSVAIMYFILGVNAGELYQAVKGVLDNSEEGGAFTVSVFYDNITNELHSSNTVYGKGMGELVKGFAVNKVRATLQEKYNKR